MEADSLSALKSTIMGGYRFNLAYAEKLVVDVQDAKLWHCPGPGLENHPAFTLGHLVMASARLARMFGEPWDTPAGWRELFDRTGPGDPTVAVAADIYPPKAELIAELKRQHLRVEAAMTVCSAENWQETVTWRFDRFMPQRGEVAAFMCLQHESMHLAQLAAWRRAMDLPSALGAL